MDLRSGLPFFWIRNGLPYPYPSLQEDIACEVLVIGDGITGALCAHACTIAGLDTVVLGARSIGTGSTSASTALLQYEIDTPLYALSEQVGAHAAVRSYQLCAQAVEELVALGTSLGLADTRMRESLQFASRPSHLAALKKEHALRTARGFAVELLDGATLRERFGIRKPGALLSRNGAELDPYALTHALLQDVLHRGGRVFERTQADPDHHMREGSVHRMPTLNGHVARAQHVILATGYESLRYLPKGVIDLDCTYAVASERTDRADLWYHDCLIWETDRPYLYLRTTSDRRIIIGGLDEPFHDLRRRDALLPRKTKQLARAFHRLFPDLPFVPEYSWCGVFGYSRDGLPYIDRDERTGMWFVLGTGGNGITFGQVGARLVRDHILGRPSPDAPIFRFDR